MARLHQIIVITREKHIDIMELSRTKDEKKRKENVTRLEMPTEMLQTRKWKTIAWRIYDVVGSYSSGNNLQKKKKK